MEPEKIRAYKDLARSALASGSYRDAYKYSSLLIEDDPLLDKVWLIKAASGAGLMGESDEVSLEELIFSLERGVKAATENDLKAISDIMNRSYRSIISSLNNSHTEMIVDHHKVPMPQGGSAILHRIAQTGYARLSAKGLSPKRLKAIKLLEKAYDLNASSDNLKFLIEQIDSFLSHSSAHSDYLNDELEIKNYLLNLRSGLMKKAFEAGITVSSNPPSSGCFIATAAAGSYDHPKVLILRLFRDSILEKSTVGRILIRTYYRGSPPIARWIDRSKNRKKFVLWLVVNPLSKFAGRVLRKYKGN